MLTGSSSTSPWTAVKRFSLKNGDKVRVRQSRFTTKLVRLSKKSFCEILDSKMGMEVATHEE